MNRGFYTIASGMLTRQRSLNAIANNMANAKTPGFKSERVVTTTFEEELMVRTDGLNRTNIGNGTSINTVEDVVSNFDAAQLFDSERPYDLAIQGNGFFTVTAADGKQYLTRNGNFDIDEEGFLILPGQGRVQGEKGDIEIGGAEFVVQESGQVYDNKGKAVDRILIQNAAEGTKLAKYANGMYMSTGELLRVQNPGIAQFVKEGSNVDFNTEMSLMMEAQRSFQSCAKALTSIDQINQKAANIAAL
ncbi:MAG: flagellar hook-basal body complex protein [Oscillospiraceae bacterium]